MIAGPSLQSNYFEFLGLPRKLVLDREALQKRYYELSRQLHPDRYANRPANEREYALDATALLNDAYRVLRDTVTRTEYLLKQEGFDIGEQRSKDVPAELLEEVFELNMLLEGTPDPVELDNVRLRLQGMMAGSDRDLSDASALFDESGDRGVLGQIRAILNRRRYIQNLLRDVDKALSTEAAV